MAEPTDVVGVLRHHLEEMYAALDRCRVYFEALDLTDRIKSGSPSSKASRTTQMVVRAHDKAAGYLEVDDEQLPEE